MPGFVKPAPHINRRNFLQKTFTGSLVLSGWSLAGSESTNTRISQTTSGSPYRIGVSDIMLLKRQETGYIAPFELIDFLVNVEHRQGRGIFAEATVKVRVDGEVLHTAAEGNGPVNALDQALRKALTPHYPALAKFHLADYKVRILDGENGTRATTRVLIDTQNGTRRWSTMGASANIIEASWWALADAVEYGLLMGQSNGNGGAY